MPTMPYHPMLHTSAALWRGHDARSDLLCKYHGKTCANPRTTKLNGTLHRFCHGHRSRHNIFQRAYQNRRERNAAKAKQCLHDKDPARDRSISYVGSLLVKDGWPDMPIEFDEHFVADLSSNGIRLTDAAHVPVAQAALSVKDADFPTFEELQHYLDAAGPCDYSRSNQYGI